MKRRLEIAEQFQREDKPLAALQVLIDGTCTDFQKLTDEEVLRYIVEHPCKENCQTCVLVKESRSDLL